ncbi:MAG TPA: ClpXP protease specificity-enhancing factor SspB [Polyangiaceae bacterium]|nr:ClpXP protease specificity-enhancing factor SspB [Polyangiaceae bacterium]
MSDSRDLPPDMGGPELPPKPDVALALLQTATSVHVYLDPRAQDVHVPAWFKKQPQLVLQVGLNMAVPIPDLDVGEEALTCTLSFNRRPEFCRIPWHAIYGLVGDDGRGMIWPDSVPPEVAAAAEGRSATKKPASRGNLRAVPDDDSEAPRAAEVASPEASPAEPEAAGADEHSASPQAGTKKRAGRKAGGSAGSPTARAARVHSATAHTPTAVSPDEAPSAGASAERRPRTRNKATAAGKGAASRASAGRTEAGPPAASVEPPRATPPAVAPATTQPTTPPATTVGGRPLPPYLRVVK